VDCYLRELGGISSLIYELPSGLAFGEINMGFTGGLSYSVS